MKKLLIFVLLATATTFAQNWSSVLDTSRAIDWSTAGTTIPSYTVNCATQPSLSTGSGAASSNTTAIQNALASCNSTHNVVNLPAGTYYLNGLTFPSQGYMVLRGQGANSTKLIMSGAVGCTGIWGDICIMASDYTYAGSSTVLPGGNRQCSWTAGYAKGTTTITLNSCGSSSPTSNGLAVGKQLVLDQANDLTDNGGIYACDSYTSSQSGGSPCTLNDGGPANADGRQIGGYTYSQKQVVVITSVSGSGTGPYTVGITPGVYFNNVRTSQNPGAWWPGTLNSVGLENVYIDGSSQDDPIIEIAGCFGCWVKGVATYDAGRSHIFTNLCSHTVIRDSYMFQSQQHATESYGVEPEQTSAELWENNIFQQLTSPLMWGNTSGSVAGYNLMIGGVYTNSNYLQASYASHNAGNNMNLLEGNNILNVATDDTWGSSHTQTYFRNFATGWQHQSSGPLWDTSPFINRAFSRANNLIGNVLGQPGFHTNYQSYATSTSSGVNTSLLSVSIYSLGWTGNGETSAGTCGTPVCDSKVYTTLMRWGNYDTVTAGIKWDTTEASPAAVSYVNANFTSSYFASLAHTLPASFYYSAQPSWWPVSKAWPPIGPDVTTGNVGTCSGGSYPGAQATSSSQCTGGTLTTAWASHATSLPAQDCFLNTMGGKPDGTDSAMLTFNASTCYTSSGSTAYNFSPAISITSGNSSGFVWIPYNSWNPIFNLSTSLSVTFSNSSQTTFGYHGRR